MSNKLVVSGKRLSFMGKTYPCAIGKGGYSMSKKEGDGATPVGRFYLRECWYRADRIDPPVTRLNTRSITYSDGWSDDPKDPRYNRHITLPSQFSHEKLWRDEHVYDLIVPLGYNDGPIVPGKGSAIFMHVAKLGYLPTEGCVALSREHLVALLAHCGTDTVMDIRG